MQVVDLSFLRSEKVRRLALLPCAVVFQLIVCDERRGLGLKLLQLRRLLRLRRDQTSHLLLQLRELHVEIHREIGRLRSRGPALSLSVVVLQLLVCKGRRDLGLKACVL